MYNSKVMVECFVAINVTYNDILLNDSVYPIIFYWDGESDILNDIKSNENFLKMIERKCFNIESYSDSYINLSYINNESENIYSEKQFQIEDVFPFEEINNDFMYGYVTEILFDLYKKVFKEEYNRNDLDDLNLNFEIKDIFNKIKEHVNKPISNETIINYIRSKMNDIYKLKQKNKDWLIEKIQNIIEEPNN